MFKDDIQTIEEKIITTNGDLLLRRYTTGKLLGKGGFASVYELIPAETRQIFAVKILDKASLLKGRARQRLMSEIKIQRFLSHKNIVKLEHHFEDNEYVYIILELCINQTLSELLRRRKRLTELEVQCYLLQVASGLKYIHSQRVIHRDIKLGNVFLTDKLEIKIGDFGLAAKLEFNGERKRTVCGTPNYIAPEILESRLGHSYEVDVWSFGVLMFTLLVGRPPFETSDIQTTYRRIKMGAYSFPEHVVISNEAKNLIELILVNDPSLRPSLSDIEQHPFFNKNLIPKLMPSSTLAVPPTALYLKQFEKNPVLRPISRERENSTSKTRSRSNNLREKADDKHTSRDRASSGDRANSRSGSPKKNGTISLYKPVPEGPKIWVKKWVDYSSKYGIGFMFSNGCPGVYFNDTSKIIGNQNATGFQYIEKEEKIEKLSQYELNSFPQELTKKVMILTHIKKHLNFDEKVQVFEDPLTCVKKWFSTSHAMIFRLSNKVVQVFFTDKTEILLGSGNKVVVYVDKRGNTYSSQLANVLENGNKEMNKRLKYTKEVLTNFTCGSGKNKVQGC